MNVIKILEEIVEIRDEINEVARKLEFQSKILDKKVYDLLEFLKMKRLVETRTVK